MIDFKTMSKGETMKWLEAKLVDIHREERMIENAINHLKDTSSTKEGLCKHCGKSKEEHQKSLGKYWCDLNKKENNNFTFISSTKNEVNSQDNCTADDKKPSLNGSGSREMNLQQREGEPDIHQENKRLLDKDYGGKK